jgi:hypothetical protein
MRRSVYLCFSLFLLFSCEGADDDIECSQEVIDSCMNGDLNDDCDCVCDTGWTGSNCDEPLEPIVLEADIVMENGDSAHFKGQSFFIDISDQSLQIDAYETDSTFISLDFSQFSPIEINQEYSIAFPSYAFVNHELTDYELYEIEATQNPGSLFVNSFDAQDTLFNITFSFGIQGPSGEQGMVKNGFARKE